MRYLWCQLLGGWTRKKERVLSCETQVSLPGGRSSPCARHLGVNCRQGSRGSSAHSECTQSPQQPQQSAPTLLAGMSASTSALRGLEQWDSRHTEGQRGFGAFR